MKSLSNLSTALIIAATIVLIGNILNDGLTAVTAANVGIILGGTTHSPGVQTVFLFWLSGILFVLGVGLAILSIIIERKKNK